jgi:hypothetical protein
MDRRASFHPLSGKNRLYTMKFSRLCCYAFFMCPLFSFFSGTTGYISQQDPWQFANFGLHAAGKVEYGPRKMTISTRYTRHCFFESDHYSFAYQRLAFPYDDCSRLTVSVKVDRFDRGSAGIMMRSDTGLGAANVHLETSATGEVFLFHRKMRDELTSYTHIATITFPVELKVVRQGNAFTAYYRKANEWVKGGSVIVDAGPAVLAGFYACSGEEFQTGAADDTPKQGTASFYDHSVNYEQDYIPPSKDYHDTTPLPKEVMLRDDFNDGSLSNGPAAINNPIWQGIEYGNLPYDPKGGRYWRKTGDGIFYLGDKKWADYQLSIDLAFDKTNPSSAECVIQLRHQDIAVYSKMERCYAVILRNGNKLVFEKNIPGQGAFSKTVMLPNYFDGKWHNLKVRLLDRNYEVYYDGRRVLTGVDTLQPVTYGNVSLKFTNTSMNVDNLEVDRIPDPMNGVTDNYLQDYYDIPIPSFLEKYGIRKTEE